MPTFGCSLDQEENGRVKYRKMKWKLFDSVIWLMNREGNEKDCK